MPEHEHTDRASPGRLAGEGRRAVEDPGLLIYERVLPALASSVSRIRREIAQTLELHNLASTRRRDDIALVVSEATTNAVVHAYRNVAPGPLYAAATLEADALTVWISDFGCGMLPNPDSAGLGMGLTLMAELSDHLQIAPATNTPGTSITVTFTAIRRASAPHAHQPHTRERRGMLSDYLHAVRAENNALRENTAAVLAQADLAVTRARRQLHQRT